MQSVQSHQRLAGLTATTGPSRKRACPIPIPRGAWEFPRARVPGAPPGPCPGGSGPGGGAAASPRRSGPRSGGGPAPGCAPHRSSSRRCPAGRPGRAPPEICLRVWYAWHVGIHGNTRSLSIPELWKRNSPAEPKSGLGSMWESATTTSVWLAFRAEVPQIIFPWSGELVHWCKCTIP